MSAAAKIMVADDEQATRELMETVLDRLGYAVLLASDGNQALKKARQEMPDLILMDIQMPGQDGLEVTRKLKEDGATKIIPIVIVSGLADIPDRVKALDAGADDFLNKPVDATELKARIRSLLKVKAYNDHMINYQKELESAVSQRTEQLKASLEKIKSASLEAIYRLSLAAEYKNKETGDHIKRVSHYAEAIAERMSLGRATIEAILYATPMHDVGKIGIPDHILLKPGKHDKQEWEIMKQHTVIGARIMEGSKYGFMQLASVIALTHHERWDGGGYPRGLKGRKIPLAGRITALADYFDAMTSERPYRRGVHTLEQTIETIRENSGSHFDPEVVECFLDSGDKITGIMNRFNQNTI